MMSGLPKPRVIAVMLVGFIISTGCSKQAKKTADVNVSTVPVDAAASPYVFETELPWRKILAAKKIKKLPPAFSPYPSSEDCRSQALHLDTPPARSTHVGDIANGDVVTISTSEIENKGQVISYRQVTSFEKIPPVLDKSFEFTGGLIQTRLDPVTGHDWMRRVADYTSEKLTGLSPEDAVVFTSFETEDTRKGYTSPERPGRIRVRFDGCATYNFEGSTLETQIWSVNQIHAKEGLFGGDPTYVDRTFFYEFSPDLGWFVRITDGDDIAYDLTTLER